MKHQGTIPLNGKICTLRRFSMADAPPAHQGWLSDPESARFLRSSVYRTLPETERFLLGQIARYSQKNQYFWAVDDEVGRLVGCVAATVDENASCAAVAFVTARNRWGEGFASDALRAVLCFLFAEIGVSRAEGVCAKANPASGAVMKKVGMLCEGTVRQQLRTGEGPQPCELWAVSAERWLKINAIK